ncbi:MAG: S8 family serine peptidase [bacterium]
MANRAPAVDPGLDGDEPEGGGQSLDGQGILDGENWPVREFTHPISGETNYIFDYSVVICFKNPPQFPDVPSNYYDEELNPFDPVYSLPMNPVASDQDVASFIASENLFVDNDWPPIRAIGAILPEGTTVEEAVENWPDDYPNLIETVEPEYFYIVDVWPITDPNDPRFSEQWALKETEAYDINIQDAWRNGYYGRSDEVVAIMDTGVQLIHGDLTSRRTPWGVRTTDKLYQTMFEPNGGQPVIKYHGNWPDPRAVPYCMMLGHGTSVAGTISAAINNAYVPSYNAVAGISPQNRYYPVGLDFYVVWVECGESGFMLSGIRHKSITNALGALGCVKGVFKKEWLYYPPFNYTVEHYNIEVVNCSFGGPKSSDIELMVGVLSGKMLFVCSAGNDNSATKFSYPAAYPRCLAVAAHASDGSRSPFSNKNMALVDISAPGSGILTTDMLGNSWRGVQLGFDPSATCTISGTSFSSPITAAVAVMLSSKHRDMSSTQLAQWIKDTHAPLPVSNPLFPFGRIDAYAALSQDPPEPWWEEYE